MPTTDEQIEKLEELRFNVRENEVPYFSEEELLLFLKKNGWDIRKASYECLITKAENTGLNVSGLTTKDSSTYFKMLAAKYRKSNTGILKGV